MQGDYRCVYRDTILLSKGSPITGCVSAAVDAITADGTLAAIEDQWLASGAGAPVLKP